MKQDSQNENDPKHDERRSAGEIRDANILVWLPSPMGDAILCTPALRAIRQRYPTCKIWFYTSPVVREVLSPNAFNDEWLEQKDENFLTLAGKLRKYTFACVILFKNTFASALTVFLAGIPSRIGYAREGRGFLLTDKLSPPRLPNGNFKPRCMVDYYLAIASRLGADTSNKALELTVDPSDDERLKQKLPEIFNATGPIVILVPGGAFGPSKCWPNNRFARTADWLIKNYNATMIISVAPEATEKQIAKEICDLSGHNLINLADRPVTLGELKALFSIADLVITNDTGPRHIAIATGRKVVTLFGPNDPAWTDTKYKNEIQIVGNVPCAPCASPTCNQNRHLCMQAITVEMVCNAAKELIEGNRKQATILARQHFAEISESFLVDPEYQSALSRLGLTSIDSVFSFQAAENLTKKNLARFRSRLQFDVELSDSPQPTTVFLKRYDSPPILSQLKNWLSARSRKSCAVIEFTAIQELSATGIGVPKVISYGECWSRLFEKKSLLITEKIPDADSIERELPECFDGKATKDKLRLRRDFIARSASFIKKFHETDYRHRDLYFSHIFYDDAGHFFLIDLARAFKPMLLGQRYRVKDLAQIYYSAPGRYFSKTDRLRFYIGYMNRRRLTPEDKAIIRRVAQKADQMARHDIRHGRSVPFTS
ncbi:MAG: lipopolysaccharide heptosyltransferase II [Sedimentisphaerales bacterium]|nr:lipopolysaccharide heptosyltransferase II [Sedimentisphaerales bacterium]